MDEVKRGLSVDFPRREDGRPSPGGGKVTDKCVEITYLLGAAGAQHRETPRLKSLCKSTTEPGIKSRAFEVLQ
ncbi:hypothetical protein llap_14059 [Limosa lapponica baueri]|uniref:Uncharacterized protein n=1 Tax=Limosa lapponica baueri TaxID=1758121 RepID=A0A2I0TPB9_LIMLA|nr:hypothetical protein llap_14059 [Limosa lapponica baueri]